MSNVPTRVTLSGNTRKAQELIGLAKAQMRILEDSMKFNALKQDFRTISYADGTVIECWSCFSLNQVNIYVPEGGKKLPKLGKECFCGCHMALGQIRYQTTHYPLAHMNVETRYDVLVCKEKEYFSYLENVKSAGFHKYLSGPLVQDAVTNEWSYSWGEPVMLLANEIISEETGDQIEDANGVGCLLIECRVLPVHLAKLEESQIEGLSVKR